MHHSCYSKYAHIVLTHLLIFFRHILFNMDNTFTHVRWVLGPSYTRKNGNPTARLIIWSNKSGFLTFLYKMAFSHEIVSMYVCVYVCTYTYWKLISYIGPVKVRHIDIIYTLAFYYFRVIYAYKIYMQQWRLTSISEIDICHCRLHREKFLVALNSVATVWYRQLFTLLRWYLPSPRQRWTSRPCL